MKYLKYVGIGILILGFLFSMAYYIQTNSRSAITYETATLSKQTIEEKIVATGSVVPSQVSYQYVHADQHGAAILESDPNKVLFVNDGGVFFSNDGGENLSSRNDNYHTSQYYTR